MPSLRSVSTKAAVLEGGHSWSLVAREGFFDDLGFSGVVISSFRDTLDILTGDEGDIDDGVNAGAAGDGSGAKVGFAPTAVDLKFIMVS